MNEDATATSAPHLLLVRQCEAYLAAHGDTHQGVGWPHYADAQARYQVMLDGLRSAVPADGQLVRVLDFGCGPGHFYEFLQRQPLPFSLDYTGLDLLADSLALARAKFPGQSFLHLDVLQQPERLPAFDYVVLNGIFTQKCALSFEQMWAYCQRLLHIIWPKTTYGLAFNAMSKQVDWERDDLFHLPLDVLAPFLTRELTRHFALRHDYGLYEFTTYLYKSPRRPAP